MIPADVIILAVAFQLRSLCCHSHDSQSYFYAYNYYVWDNARQYSVCRCVDSGQYDVD